MCAQTCRFILTEISVHRTAFVLPRTRFDYVLFKFIAHYTWNLHVFRVQLGGAPAIRLPGLLALIFHFV